MDTRELIKERPILFSGSMVRAILDGRKTQTRRALKDQPVEYAFECDDEPGFAKFGYDYISDHATMDVDQNYTLIKCPYGKPGDRLWVRENWQVYGAFMTDEGWEVDYPIKPIPKAKPERCLIDYAADDAMDGPHRPSIHMPRWASRITLEITGVRVERLQDISDGDAIKEGIQSPVLPKEITPEPGDYIAGPVTGFAILWNSINAERGLGWSTNPWVWVIEFKKVEA